MPCRLASPPAWQGPELRRTRPVCRSALTSGMALTLSPCKPAGKRKDVPEGGTIEQIEKVRLVECIYFYNI